ncbi:hypothetical protein Cgig2_010286 [Carnegiea gigantea]|uniref:Uncharacterized protein n=1 Tax=Carnegiea gigantea TaxID=171969 RepID=A0A9Q1GQX8_9CARY|nr:hypothetical protein Cgig2_010286 [Carnegiea gigantea]
MTKIQQQVPQPSSLTPPPVSETPSGYKQGLACATGVWWHGGSALLGLSRLAFSLANEFRVSLRHQTARKSPKPSLSRRCLARSMQSARVRYLVVQRGLSRPLPCHTWDAIGHSRTACVSNSSTCLQMLQDIEKLGMRFEIAKAEGSIPVTARHANNLIRRGITARKSPKPSLSRRCLARSMQSARVRYLVVQRGLSRPLPCHTWDAIGHSRTACVSNSSTCLQMLQDIEKLGMRFKIAKAEGSIPVTARHANNLIRRGITARKSPKPSLSRRCLARSMQSARVRYLVVQRGLSRPLPCHTWDAIGHSRTACVSNSSTCLQMLQDIEKLGMRFKIAKAEGSIPVTARHANNLIRRGM